MKKLIAVFAAALMGLSAYAQVGITVGGSMGFTYSSVNLTSRQGTLKDSRKISSGASFKFLPEVGYQFNDKLNFGAQVGYMHGYAALGAFDLSDFKGLANLAVGVASDLGLNGTKDDGSEVSPAKIDGIRFAPYARYNFLHTKYIDLFAEAGFGWNMAFVRENRLEGEWKTRTVHIIDLLVRPGIALNLGKEFQIIAKFGSFGWQGGIGKVTLEDETTGEKVKYTGRANRIGFDFDTSNILFGLGYKF